jgi:uncharacterized protein YyaL (SSP411 family)
VRQVTHDVRVRRATSGHPGGMNRLADAASPYLRQHADNPVDWYEWGDEAFARARETDRPVFLSVGYSACHWCHVMAHESFEDARVAALLNAEFVSIKVDREERPDVDAVYMNAVQALTGRGGWPMSVFLTPDGQPFFGGTYWPREDRGGMPGFVRVLASVAEIWRNQRDRVDEAGHHLSARLQAVSASPAAAGAVDDALARLAAETVVAQWDRHEGGFGAAPKFPHAMVLDFLLAHAQRTGDAAALEAATHTLTAMSRGGIYDHVAGGFARYATDRRWLVPHFEKMLYDNALLVRTYTHAAQLTGDPRFVRIVEETIAWLFDDLANDAGGFACAMDADSEGQEGKYYVWTSDEFAAAATAAGVEPATWTARWGVTARGNVNDPHGHIPEGTSIIHEATALPEDDEVLAARRRLRHELRTVRAGRVPPATDDKVLVSWNALAIGALAVAGAALDRPTWIAAAGRTARFLTTTLVDGDGRLLHRWAPGHGAGIPAFAEDVTFLAQALLDLYEAGHDPQWLGWARRLATDADTRFRDTDGTYFTTPADGEQLIARPRELLDNAIPSSSSVMADVHLRLAALTDEPSHADAAARTISTLAGSATRMPLAFGALLGAVERQLAPSTEVAIVGARSPARDALIREYRRRWRPGAVLAVGDPGERGTTTDDVPLLRDRPTRDGTPTAYVCHHFVCALPVTSPDALRAQLDDDEVDHAPDAPIAQPGDHADGVPDA